MLAAIRPKLVLVFFLLAALVAAPIGCDTLRSGDKPLNSESGPRTIYSLGRLEPATGIIDIRATPGDRLRELFGLVENELAPADGILGLLSSYDMGRAQLVALLKKREVAIEKHRQQQEMAAAQLAQAKASRAQAKAKQTELTLQQGKLDALKVARDLAQDEYHRLEELQEKDSDLVTQHQLDKKKNEMELAAQDYKIAQESHVAAMGAADLAVSAAEANIKVAATAQEQAGKNYERLVVDQEITVAREALKRSILLAPNASQEALSELLAIKADEELPEMPGDSRISAAATEAEYTVLKVLLRRGEVVTQSPILQLGDLSNMVCIAEVHEADVKELWVGQKVTIRSTAFSHGYGDGPRDPETEKRTGGIRGEVRRISQMVAPPTVSNRNPLAPIDRSVVEVRIEIDADQAPTGPGAPPKPASGSAIKEAASHVGMDVTVEFDGPTRENEAASPLSEDASREAEESDVAQ